MYGKSGPSCDVIQLVPREVIVRLYSSVLLPLHLPPPVHYLSTEGVWSQPGCDHQEEAEPGAGASSPGDCMVN